jgi:hypothetical protein
MSKDPFGLGSVPPARPVTPTPGRPTASPAPAAPPSAQRPEVEPARRTTIAALTGERRRHAGAERAQLNILTPAPVLLRFRALVDKSRRPAWELLEEALDALEGRSS